MEGRGRRESGREGNKNEGGIDKAEVNETIWYGMEWETQYHRVVLNNN